MIWMQFLLDEGIGCFFVPHGSYQSCSGCSPPSSLRPIDNVVIDILYKISHALHAFSDSLPIFRDHTTAAGFGIKYVVQSTMDQRKNTSVHLTGRMLNWLSSLCRVLAILCTQSNGNRAGHKAEDKVNFQSGRYKTWLGRGFDSHWCLMTLACTPFTSPNKLFSLL